MCGAFFPPPFTLVRRYLACHVTLDTSNHFPELIRIDLLSEQTKFHMDRSRVSRAEFLKALPSEREKAWPRWRIEGTGIVDPTAMWVDEGGDKVMISACLTQRGWTFMERDATCSGVYQIKSSLLPVEWGGTFDVDAYLAMNS